MRRSIVGVLCTVGALFALVACGSDSSDSDATAATSGTTAEATTTAAATDTVPVADTQPAPTEAAPSTTAASTLPDTIPLYAINDLSGITATVGGLIKNGMDLAITDINKSGLLGSSQLTIEYGDSATTPATGANLATQAVANDFPIIFGSPSSPVSEAEAPIFASDGVPAIFTQAGGQNVLVDDNIFRITTQQTERILATLAWLQSQGAKTVSVIYVSDNSTLATLGQITQDHAADFGMEVVENVAVQQAQADISAAITKALDAKPDAIQLVVVPTQNATAVTAIRQSGFAGPIGAQDGAGGAALAGAGAAADGVTWAADWLASAAADFGDASVAFAAAYQATYQAPASNFAAEAYDAVWFAARGIAKAQSLDADALTQALIAVGTEGFTGALGDVTVVDGQLISKPVLVEWRNGALGKAA